jgi:hypothetical protein
MTLLIVNYVRSSNTTSGKIRDNNFLPVYVKIYSLISCDLTLQREQYISWIPHVPA